MRLGVVGFFICLSKEAAVTTVASWFYIYIYIYARARGRNYYYLTVIAPIGHPIYYSPMYIIFSNILYGDSPTQKKVGAAAHLFSTMKI